MPRHYPPEVRREACERMLAGEAIKDLAGEAIKDLAGEAIKDLADELGITVETLYRWRRQALIDIGRRPGVKSFEADRLAAARRRIQEL